MSRRPSTASSFEWVESPHSQHSPGSSSYAEAAATMRSASRASSKDSFEMVDSRNASPSMRKLSTQRGYSFGETKYDDEQHSLPLSPSSVAGSVPSPIALLCLQATRDFPPLMRLTDASAASNPSPLPSARSMRIKMHGRERKNRFVEEDVSVEGEQKEGEEAEDTTHETQPGCFVESDAVSKLEGDDALISNLGSEDFDSDFDEAEIFDTYDVCCDWELRIKQRQQSIMGERVTYKSQQTRKLQREEARVKLMQFRLLKQQVKAAQANAPRDAPPAVISLNMSNKATRTAAAAAALARSTEATLDSSDSAANSEDDSDVPLSKADIRRNLMAWSRSSSRLRILRAKRAARQAALVAAKMTASTLPASLNAKETPHDPRSTSRRAPNPLLRTNRSSAAAMAAAKPGHWLVRHSVPSGPVSVSLNSAREFSGHVLPLVESQIRGVFEDASVGSNLLELKALSQHTIQHDYARAMACRLPMSSHRDLSTMELRVYPQQDCAYAKVAFTSRRGAQIHPSIPVLSSKLRWATDGSLYYRGRHRQAYSTGQKPQTPLTDRQLNEWAASHSPELCAGTCALGAHRWDGGQNRSGALGCDPTRHLEALRRARPSRVAQEDAGVAWKDVSRMLQNQVDQLAQPPLVTAQSNPCALGEGPGGPPVLQRAPEHSAIVVAVLRGETAAASSASSKRALTRRIERLESWIGNVRSPWREEQMEVLRDELQGRRDGMAIPLFQVHYQLKTDAVESPPPHPIRTAPKLEVRTVQRAGPSKLQVRRARQANRKISQRDDEDKRDERTISAVYSRFDRGRFFASEMRWQLWEDAYDRACREWQKELDERKRMAEEDAEEAAAEAC